MKRAAQRLLGEDEVPRDPEHELYLWLKARLERNLPLDRWHREVLEDTLHKLKTHTRTPGGTAP